MLEFKAEISSEIFVTPYQGLCSHMPKRHNLMSLYLTYHTISERLNSSEEKLRVPDNFLSECVTSLNTGRNEEEESLYTLRFLQNIFRKNDLYVVFSLSVSKLCALLPKPSLITSLILVNMGDTTGGNVCVENSWFRCRKNVNALYFTSC